MCKHYLTFLAIFAGGFFGSSSVSAQWFGGGWGQPPAATVGESHARGMADIIRAEAQRTYLNSAAAGQVEDARTKYLNNRALAAQTYVANRQLRDEYRQERHEESRRRLMAYLESGRYRPISSSELYEDTGQVTWPPLLQHPQYEDERQQIETVLKRRAIDGAINGEDFMLTTLRLDEWRRSLVDTPVPFSMTDARESAQFLNRLKNHLRDDFR